MPASPDQEIRTLRTSFWSVRDPDGRAFAPLAEAFRKLGDLDEADALLHEGLGRHPTFTTGLLIAARVARDRRDLVLARGHLDRLLEIDAGNALALAERGELEFAEPSPPAPPVASEELEVAAEEEFPDRPILTRTMGDIYARQGFLERAVEVYEYLLAVHPDDEEIGGRLAELRAGGGAVGVGVIIEADDIVAEADTLKARETPVDMPGWDPGAGAEVDSDGEGEPAGITVSGRTIHAYFEDLLAWVPGAVPIASLAPGAPARAAAEEPHAAAEAPPSEAPPAERKEELDDFHRWLESLGT